MLYSVQHLVSNNLYFQCNVCTDSDIFRLREYYYTLNEEERVDLPSVRKVGRKLIQASELPNYTKKMYQLLDMYLPTESTSKYEIRRYSYFRYKPGDLFRRHTDFTKKDNPYEERRFSTITLTKKTFDLEGGDLIIWNEDKTKPTKIELEVGDSVIFDTKYFHEVTEIKKGYRESIIGWVHYKYPT